LLLYVRKHATRRAGSSRYLSYCTSNELEGDLLHDQTCSASICRIPSVCEADAHDSKSSCSSTIVVQPVVEAKAKGSRPGLYIHHIDSSCLQCNGCIGR
ncbi:hypothetical protein EJB05_10329, partial [Eragrostis curvula]